MERPDEGDADQEAFLAEPKDDDPNYPRMIETRSQVPPPLAIDLFKLAGDRNWNEEFQALVGAPSGNPEKDLQRATLLRKLCEEFANTAKSAGTTIISELFLPAAKKTIMPLTQIGGVAGGEKFVKEGIFFKIAVDKRNLYGGDEGIMKAAGHELRSQMSYIDCRIAGLHFPLIVLVDYLGYRLIAESVLPIGADTLIYGSSDGGTRIHASNPEMNARMELAAKILNLRGDWVWNWAGTEKALLYGPIDIEGHLGRDGRMYLLDTARVSPPATPIEGLRGGFLYRLLRPELVKGNRVPLSSNAFSNWKMEDAAQADAEVREATRRLEVEVVPRFAKSLANEYSKMAPGEIQLRAQMRSLVVNTHRKGINIKLLGLVRAHVTNKSLRLVLLMEMLARVAKNTLRSKMRCVKSPVTAQYRALVVDYFNLLFGRDERSTLYWNIELKHSLQQRFRKCLSQEEQAITFDLRAAVDMLAVFLRVQETAGVKFRIETQERIYGDPTCFEPFVDADLEEIFAVVKYIHRISFEEGTALAQQATKTGADELFRLADEKYQDSVQIKPDDYRALHNWGLSLSLQAATKQGEEADALFKLAGQKFHAALAINPKDNRALFLWGNLLSEQSRQKEGRDATNLLIQACAKYQKSFHIDPNNFELLYNWGNAFLYRAKSENDAAHFAQACDKYALATKLKPNSHKCLRNWAAALAKWARTKAGAEADALFAQAHERSKTPLSLCSPAFKACMSIRPADWEVLFNWGNTLYRQARMKEREGDQLRSFELLQTSASKYLAVLEISHDSSDALHNWGKVLQCQGMLMRLIGERKEAAGPAPASVAALSASFVDTLAPIPAATPLQAAVRTIFYQQLDVYLELFRCSALKYPAKVSLKPLLALAQLADADVTARVLDVLFQLSHAEGSGTKASVAKAAIQALTKDSPVSASPAVPRTKMPEEIERILQRIETSASISTLSISDFEVVTAVGGMEGSSEREFHVRLRRAKQYFNLKILSREVLKARLGSNPTVASIESLLRSLKHPYLSTYHHVIHSEDSVFLLYDILSCVPIKKLTDNGQLSETQLRFYAAEIVSALQHLHGLGLAYVHLRADEIFIDPEGHVTLPRFAFHRATENSAAEADWTMLARAMFELISGLVRSECAYACCSYESQRDKARALSTLQMKLSPEFLSLIKALLSKSIVTAAQAMAHPFFAGVNWDAVSARQPSPPLKPPVQRPSFPSEEPEPAAQQYDTINFDAAPTLVAKLKKGKFHGFTYVSPGVP